MLNILLVGIGAVRPSFFSPSLISQNSGCDPLSAQYCTRKC
jgi:hypothetical protein